MSAKKAKKSTSINETELADVAGGLHFRNPITFNHNDSEVRAVNAVRNGVNSAKRGAENAGKALGGAGKNAGRAVGSWLKRQWNDTR